MNAWCNYTLDSTISQVIFNFKKKKRKMRVVDMPES